MDLILKILDAGGLLALSAIVYMQVREQTKVLTHLSISLKALTIQQQAIVDKQSTVAADVAHIARVVRPQVIVHNGTTNP